MQVKGSFYVPGSKLGREKVTCGFPMSDFTGGSRSTRRGTDPALPLPEGFLEEVVPESSFKGRAGGAPEWLSLLSVRLSVSAQVMISWFVSSSPTLGSALTGRSLLGILSLCPSPVHSLCLSQNKSINLKKREKGRVGVGREMGGEANILEKSVNKAIWGERRAVGSGSQLRSPGGGGFL